MKYDTMNKFPLKIPPIDSIGKIVPKKSLIVNLVI